MGPGKWFDLTKEQARGIVVMVNDKDGWPHRYEPGRVLPRESTWADISSEVARTEKKVREWRMPTPFLKSEAYWHRDSLLERLAAAEGETPARGPWPEGLPFPRSLKPYKRAEYTQRVSILNDQYASLKVSRLGLPEKWNVPGGLEGVRGWQSFLYEHLPGNDDGEGFGPIHVVNHLAPAYTVALRGRLRNPPNGSFFVDVLVNEETGKVFETRTHETEDGDARFLVLQRDRDARPAGYKGVASSQCADCHAQAGTGGYGGNGLIPGGGRVLSKPFRWELHGAP